MTEPKHPSVIVTGAANGIGAATVAALVARGANVFAVDRDDQVKQLAADLGDNVVAHQADLADPEAVRDMVESAVQCFGSLDAIHNNAGILGDAEPVETYPLETFERVYAINMRAVFLAMKHAVPHLRKAGGGAILNTASTGALVGAPGMTGYVAAKHAVLGLTRCVALELATDNIRVNALCPGPTATTMMSAYFDGKSEEEEKAAAAAITPSGRMGRPAEIGEVAAWALLEAPAFMTGTPIVVDGAQTARA